MALWRGGSHHTTSVFHVALMVLFGLLLAGGVVALALYQAGVVGRETLGDVRWWGTLPSSHVSQFLQRIRDQRGVLEGVRYRELPPASYYPELLEALAAGRGPDLFTVDEAHLLKQMDKMLRFPYATMDARTYRSRYLEIAEVFLHPEGILAFPFTVDPLVLYWNRDLFAAAGVAVPPRYWDEVLALIPKLAVVTNDQRIRQAAIALGTYRNITHAKAVLSLFFLQAGAPITQWYADGRIGVDLDGPQARGDEVIRFYHAFADPLTAAYTWNPSLPQSRELFVRGDLAMYLGFASEYDALREANPNLNFDVAMVPQVRGAARPVTYARVVALAVPRATRNPRGALAAMALLTSPEALQVWHAQSKLPPVVRTLINKPPEDDAVAAVTYYAALNARTWLEPDPQHTDEILARLVEDVASGRRDAQSAVSAARAALEAVMPRMP